MSDRSASYTMASLTEDTRVRKGPNKKYKYFQKVQAIMNKKKSKNKKQDKQSEKPVPRKKEEEQTEGTGRNSAQNPCYGLLVCTGISYIYCLDFKNKNPGSYFNTSVSLADHY